MKKYYIIIFLFTLISCKKGNDKLNKNNKLLKLESQKAFAITDSTYIGIANRKDVYKENDSLYFFTLNGMQQKLEAINLSSQKKELEINFYEKEEFLREQFSFDDFYIHNLDSIFIFSSSNSKLVLINKSGFINNRWNLNSEIEKNQSDSFLQITTTGLSSFFYDKENETILFKSYPPFDLNKDLRFYKKPFGIKYSLKESSLKESFGTWPEYFVSEDDFLPNEYIFNYIPSFKENAYYVSHRYDHNIYKYNIDDNKLIATYDGKSNFLTDFQRVPKTQESQKIGDYITENGAYNKFIFEKEKKQYYRVVTHNQPLMNSKTQKVNNATFNRDFSVIIFDKRMSKIGEYKFDSPEDFTFFDVIPTPEGLMINYKDSEDENKNHFEFIDF